MLKFDTKSEFQRELSYEIKKTKTKTKTKQNKKTKIIVDINGAEYG